MQKRAKKILPALRYPAYPERLKFKACKLTTLYY